MAALDVVQTSGQLKYYVDKIKDRVERVSHDFFSIGYYLWEVNHFKYYLENGYKNIYEFAEKELNFKRSSTNNFILLVEKYADYSQGNYPKMWMDKKYKDFGYSHLVEMLCLSPSAVEKVTEDMTIKEIREVKKAEKLKEKNIVEVEFVAGHQEESKVLREVQVKNFVTGKVYSNLILCDERLAAAQDKKIFSNEECEKMLELLTDRYKLIENFIDNGDNVASMNVLQAEIKLLESIMSKI